jgi:hypothetical protein
VIDIEIDGAEGYDSYTRLVGEQFVGEQCATAGWFSRRGPQFLWRWDDRLKPLNKAQYTCPGLSRFGIPPRLWQTSPKRLSAHPRGTMARPASGTASPRSPGCPNP